ncbi:MAG: hypothetical protein OSJ43_06750 [Oscillospiraceae bacterium]|nr:hypothetical protein [Oscillospiraceae bacterium]
MICTNLQNDNEITPKSQACKYFKHRTVWNAHLLIGEIKARARRVFDVCIRAPIGGLRKPVRLVWTDDYNFATDSIIRNAIPECPHCGEMAYNTKRCVFCGQRFIQDEHTAEWNKPSEIIKMNCPHCGGKNTLVGARSKINGHFHGECEKCGCRIME